MTWLGFIDGARLLSLECAVLWVPALIFGMAIGFWWGSRSRRVPARTVLARTVERDVSGVEIDGP